MKRKVLLFATLNLLLLTACQKENLMDSEAQLQSETIEGQTRAHLGAFAFVSTNTGSLGIFAVGAAIDNPASMALDQRFASVPYADADGLAYDSNRNALYQVDRSNSRLVALSSVSEIMDGDALTPTAMGPSSFSNGREATLYNNKVVVADDVTPGRLSSYHVNVDNISDFRNHDVGMELWGIQVSGKDLYAIEDETGNVAYFKDFFRAQSGMLAPTMKVGIEGLVRTHGLMYDAHHDIMVLTDIGAAGDAFDGALIIIENFKWKMANAGNGGLISLADQVRISGNSTLLGNPVDVAIDVSQGAIFVAEKARDGGKFLVFSMPESSGEYSPVFSQNVAGASAVALDID